MKMKEKIYKTSLAVVAIGFTLILAWLVTPPLSENFDIVNAFASGFVNPFSSGYSLDAICCWIVLAIWIVYEYPKVKYGWICLLLGLIPGVVVGFALYLILRSKQLKPISLA